MFLNQVDLRRDRVRGQQGWAGPGFWGGARGCPVAAAGMRADGRQRDRALSHSTDHEHTLHEPASGPRDTAPDPSIHDSSATPTWQQLRSAAHRHHHAASADDDATVVIMVHIPGTPRRMVQKPGTPHPDGSDQERDGPGNSGRGSSRPGPSPSATVRALGLRSSCGQMIKDPTQKLPDQALDLRFPGSGGRI
jgi:hypothetical protein